MHFIVIFHCFRVKSKLLRLGSLNWVNQLREAAFRLSISFTMYFQFFPLPTRCTASHRTLKYNETILTEVLHVLHRVNNLSTIDAQFFSLLQDVSWTLSYFSRTNGLALVISSVLCWPCCIFYLHHTLPFKSVTGLNEPLIPNAIPN